MILYQHIMIKTWQNWSFNNIYSPTLVLLNCFFNYGRVIIQPRGGGTYYMMVDTLFRPQGCFSDHLVRR